MRSTFKVLFYLKKNAPRKSGLVPLMCRITVDGGISQLSCKLDVDPKQWDTPSGRATGRSEQSREVNRFVDKVRASIHQHYHDLTDRDGSVTAEKVKNAFLGLDQRSNTLLKVFEQHNRDFSLEVDGALKSGKTYSKYKTVYGHLKDFLKYRYNLSDIALKELTPAFITDFQLYLRTVKKCSHNTVWVYLMPLRRMVTTAIKNRWLTYDPFADHEIGMEETERGFLTKDELRLLADCTVEGKRKTCIGVVRDLFLFCCFTGLSFCDMKSLTEEEVVTGNDGNRWIVKRRGKTGVSSRVRLMDFPLQVIEKYRGLGRGGRVFPAPGYKSCRKHISAAAEMCGIKKHVTWHMSRHTYATEVCITNGVSIESLSKMLGHKNIMTTQLYGKVTSERISRETDLLAARLDRIDQFKGITV